MGTDSQPDTRPLSEKLADEVAPVISVIDLRRGGEVKIVGNGQDIERVRAACKQKLKQIESDKLDPSDKFTVTVPARDPN